MLITPMASSLFYSLVSQRRILEKEKIGMLPLVALGCLFSLRTIVDSCLRELRRELRRIIVLIPVGVKNMFSCFVTKVIINNNSLLKNKITTGLYQEKLFNFQFNRISVTSE